MLSSLKKKAKHFILKHFVYRRQPILLLTPPKTGTIALIEGLESIRTLAGILPKLNIVFCHSLDAGFLETSVKNKSKMRQLQYQTALPYILNKQGVLKVLIPIREPLQQMISFFYYFGAAGQLSASLDEEGRLMHDRFVVIKDPNRAQELTTCLLQGQLRPCVEAFFNEMEYRIQLDFIEKELSFFGLQDPYKLMKPLADDAWIIENGANQLLILKGDNGFNEPVLNQFFGLTVQIPKGVNAIKDENYQKFKQLVMEELPNQKEWLQKWQNHPFMEKFYPDTIKEGQYKSRN